jgi:hypothetical protein
MAEATVLFDKTEDLRPTAAREAGLRALAAGEKARCDGPRSRDAGHGFIEQRAPEQSPVEVEDRDRLLIARHAVIRTHGAAGYRKSGGTGVPATVQERDGSS